MNNSRQTQQPAGMTLGDIYYVVFRHKWKIILLSLAGILAAVALYFLNPSALPIPGGVVDPIRAAGEIPVLGGERPKGDRARFARG